MPAVRADSRLMLRLACVFSVAVAADALGQDAGSATPAFTLSPGGQWTTAEAPDPSSPAGQLARAARLIAEGDPDTAKDILDDWIKARRRSDNPLLPRAYLLRGDAKLADGDEYQALYDYEVVITDYPNSEEFITAVAREAEIAKAYLDGLKRKFLGLRIETSRRVGEELLIRTQERLPGSAIAEESAFRLARHYFDIGEMRLAAEMYSIFQVNFDQSPLIREALLGQIYSNVAGFKGPRYDASVLFEAELLLSRYTARYPAAVERDPVISGLGERIDESRAQHRLEAANWYLRTGKDHAASFMLKRLIRSHPRSAAAGEAAELLDQINAADGGTP
ncbi:MAG: tetratricopeptide repeat protein [Planctomycetota bacterium]